MAVSRLHKDYSLKKHNTFHLEARARWFLEVGDARELTAFSRGHPEIYGLPRLVIGAGSNLLFTGDYDGLVLLPVFGHIAVCAEEKDTVYVRAGAGVVWDDLVVWSVEHRCYGLENLSFIPGHVGAAPVQNIGAYGVEVRDVVHEVEVVDLQTLGVQTLSNTQCRFGYRDSLFKNAWRDRVLITQVMFRLSKRPRFNLAYGQLQAEVERSGHITLPAVREAVIRIRQGKLPDPRQVGNAGSFFKNPIIPYDRVDELRRTYPNAPVYLVDDTHAKIAAGWLIEQCGFKGRSHKHAAVYDKQALVIVNTGHAHASDIVELSDMIRAAVLSQFGIQLVAEVRFV